MPGHNQAPGTVGMVLESPARSARAASVPAIAGFDAGAKLAAREETAMEPLEALKCDICDQPTQADTSAVNGALGVRVCTDCLRGLRMMEERAASIALAGRPLPIRWAINALVRASQAGFTHATIKIHRV